MVGVGQNSLRTEVVHFLHSESFNDGARGGTHESGRLDVAVRRMNSANAGEALSMMDVEL